MRRTIQSWRRRASTFLHLLAIIVLVTVGACLPGTQSTGIAPEAPSDEVLATMLRSIEERKIDRFLSSVDPTCVPSPDKLWSDLNDFMNRAELIEYNVTVERRTDEGNDRVTYVFSWQRKFDSKVDGGTVNRNGRSEWTYVRRPGEPFMLVQLTGEPLF